MWRLPILVVVVCCLVKPVTADEPVETANRINDGSFEGRLGNNGLPQSWNAYPSFATIEAFTQPGGRTGDRCLKFRSIGDWSIVETPHVKLQPANRQVAEIWYRASAPSDARLLLYIGYYRDDHTEVGKSDFAVVELAGRRDPAVWQSLKIEGMGLRSHGATTFALVAVLQSQPSVGSNRPGEVLLDDFELRQSIVDPQTSLIANGDMEVSVEQIQKLVKAAWPVENTFTVGIDTETPHGGKACLKVTGKADSASFRILMFDIPPGKTIRGTAWKRSKHGQGGLHLYAGGPAGKVLEQILELDANPEWREIPWKLTPDQLGNATFLIIGVAAFGEFEILCDDVAVWIE